MFILAYLGLAAIILVLIVFVTPVILGAIIGAKYAREPMGAMLLFMGDKDLFKFEVRRRIVEETWWGKLFC